MISRFRDWTVRRWAVEGSAPFLSFCKTNCLLLCCSIIVQVWPIIKSKYIYRFLAFIPFYNGIFTSQPRQKTRIVLEILFDGFSCFEVLSIPIFAFCDVFMIKCPSSSTLSQEIWFLCTTVELYMICLCEARIWIWGKLYFFSTGLVMNNPISCAIYWENSYFLIYLVQCKHCWSPREPLFFLLLLSIQILLFPAIGFKGNAIDSYWVDIG